MRSFSTISYRSVNGIGALTIDRPPMNGMTVRMVRELYELLCELTRTLEPGVLVVTGAGGPGNGFCPGADIKTG